MRRNKRGSIADIFVLLAIILIVAVAYIYISKPIHDVTTAIEVIPIVNESPEAVASIQETRFVTENMDYMPVTVFFMFVIVMLIMASILPTSPLFLVLFIILGSMAMVIAPVLSNSYESIIANQAISGHVSTYFPMTTFLISYLPYITLGIVALMALILYGKWKTG